VIAQPIRALSAHSAVDLCSKAGRPKGRKNFKNEMRETSTALSRISRSISYARALPDMQMKLPPERAQNVTQHFRRLEGRKGGLTPAYYESNIACAFGARMWGDARHRRL